MVYCGKAHSNMNDGPWLCDGADYPRGVGNVKRYALTGWNRGKTCVLFAVLLTRPKCPEFLTRRPIETRGNAREIDRELSAMSRGLGFESDDIIFRVSIALSRTIPAVTDCRCLCSILHRFLSSLKLHMLLKIEIASS